MRPSERKVSENLDGLRLLALGRIPRCTDCPRYRALVAEHANGSGPVAPLPAVPQACHHAVCAPLAVRYERRTRGAA